MAKYLKLSLGDTVEETSLPSSAGTSSAGRIPELDPSGRLDMTMMPVGVGLDVTFTTAGEALSAGDFVYFDTQGRALRADATTVTKAAQGFTTTGVIMGANVNIYYNESNTGVTGLTPGISYFLSGLNPGKMVTSDSLPIGTGKIIQRLGFAQTATSLHSAIKTPIILA